MNEPFTMTHLHYPEIPPAEQAEAFLAWKRGEIIEYWGGDGLGWVDVQLRDGLARVTIIRRKPAATGSAGNAALAGEMMLALHRAGEAQRLIAFASEHLLRAVQQFGALCEKLKAP